MLAAQLSPFARGRAGTAPVGRTVAWVALAYGTLGAFGAIAALALGNDPLTTEPWLPVDGAFAACLSLGLGLGVAVATIAATRASRGLGSSTVTSARWFRAPTTP